MIKFETILNENSYNMDLPGGGTAAVKVVTTVTTPNKVSLTELEEYIKKHAVPVHPDYPDEDLKFDGDAIGLDLLSDFSASSLNKLVDEVVDYLINELNVQVNQPSHGN